MFVYYCDTVILLYCNALINRPLHLREAILWRDNRSWDYGLNPKEGELNSVIVVYLCYDNPNKTRTAATTAICGSLSTPPVTLMHQRHCRSILAPNGLNLLISNSKQKHNPSQMYNDFLMSSSVEIQWRELPLLPWVAGVPKESCVD